MNYRPGNPEHMAFPITADKQFTVSNWSEDVRFTPANIARPENEFALQQVLESSIEAGSTVRCIGAAHSCSRIFETNETLIMMDNFKGMISHDAQSTKVTFGAATTVEEAGESLFGLSLGMENTGHINKQALAGAMATGTHGAGKKLTNLSGQMTEARLVTGNAETRHFTLDNDPEIMQALKVSLGSMGIFTQITLKALPAFRLHRRQYCCSTEDCLEHLSSLMEENRNFCFYWYPRRDDVSLRLWNLPGAGTRELPYAKLYKEFTGWGKDVLPTEQHLKFNELEYSFDIDTAPHCFRAIRKRINEKYRKQVAWRVLYRPVAADNAYLSNAFEKDIVAITVHQHAALPYEEYFNDVEDIFQSFGGRPHWAKKHSMTAKDLQKLYPMWDKFQKIRRQFDPNGIFLNDYLKRIFID